ncbi:MULTISPECIES: zf-TFIIB domain-containing protein [unclassified Sphingomonas]|uniref:TFIIB-type zinc ribbon-containing protein n=1 Tax=unclassified Sphingomonas TaxID=196159 RepID=UPI002151A3AF|nr:MULTISPECIES: zf-TFIIB domain-containing protein [unclassified Sphingomonas]MCR5871657.1 zf-TFIIB domain-containing protein [Sphingomonas sp. J344]UUY00054.1 zf-TFIIB domain-containing protein [Sphingomonas sp. J315]
MRTPEAVAGMLCPVCKTGLHMSDRQGIEIDYCPQCRGIWLDRGELDKIIERSGAGEAPVAPRAPQSPQPPQASPWPQQGGGYPQQQGYGGGYGHQGHDPRYYKHKRKKSFLEELFD